MERYQVVGHLRLDQEGTVTSYADAQATVEALQAIIKQMGEQAAVLAKDGMAAKAQVEALQRERDEWKASCNLVEGVLKRDDLQAALDAEREKVKDWQSGHAGQKVWIAQLQSQLSQLQESYSKILLSRERIERELRGYPPVDSEGIPMVWEEPVGWVKRTLDATTPAPMGSNILEEDIGKAMMRSKGGDGE